MEDYQVALAQGIHVFGWQDSPEEFNESKTQQYQIRIIGND